MCEDVCVDWLVGMILNMFNEDGLRTMVNERQAGELHMARTRRE